MTWKQGGLKLGDVGRREGELDGSKRNDDELDGDRVQTMHAKSALSALMLAIVCRMKTTVSLNI